MSLVLRDGRDRIRREDCQTVQCGPIHIADAAADSVAATLSEVLTSAPPPIKVSVKCDDILRELLADGVWHWTYEDSDESR
jgi:hypothetical protein